MRRAEVFVVCIVGALGGCTATAPPAQSTVLVRPNEGVSAPHFPLDSIISIEVTKDQVAPVVIHLRAGFSLRDSSLFRTQLEQRMRAAGFVRSSQWTRRTESPWLIVPCYIGSCDADAHVSDARRAAGYLFERPPA